MLVLPAAYLLIHRRGLAKVVSESRAVAESAAVSE
jgi:hypothetical protein